MKRAINYWSFLLLFLFNHYRSGKDDNGFTIRYQKATLLIQRYFF